MTKSIRFDELTWPEVAALPRELPLVLTLGDCFESNSIGAALGTEDWALLPALPYGWEGSPITID